LDCAILGHLPTSQTRALTTSSFGDEEETAVIVLANKALKSIKEKLVIHPLHAAATILHPHLKSMESLTPFGEREVERCKRLGHELIKVAMHQTAAASIEKEAPLHNPKPESNTFAVLLIFASLTFKTEQIRIVGVESDFAMMS
jgi:hypothetical protein